MARANKMSIWKKKGYLWVTLTLFSFSLFGHWFYGWKVYASEQEAHGQAIVIAEYCNEMMRDTLENWQSEFLQLMWQICGLAILLYVGSPDSKEGDERKEEKMDLILKRLYPEEYAEILKELEEKYPKK